MCLAFHRSWPLALMLVLLVASCNLSDCYDPMDPNGNITITFDIHKWTNDGYVARVTVQNYYQYRLVDKPGWTIGWTWANAEVIWSMYGAFATQQGNCSNHMFQVPHSCKKDPVILDLTPEAAPENRTEGCCQSGLLSACESHAVGPWPWLHMWTCFRRRAYSLFRYWGQEKSSSFQDMEIDLHILSFLGEQITCLLCLTLEFLQSHRHVLPDVQLRVQRSKAEYIFMYKVFRNLMVSSNGHGSPGNAHPNSRDDTDVLQCTDHNCPVRVHWHVKNNYADHWRVKLTVSNYNYKRNYSNWNILVQHPGFNQSSKAFSFNSTMLPTVGFEDEVALFWGYDSYNNELLQANHDQLGSVTTEILLEKDADSFTLSNGWAFPRKIYFNGENCQMPLPDTFPMLPNHDVGLHPPPLGFLLLLTLLSLKQLLD
ncbi:protein COBRA-like isoform X2 [Punica granatum]|uniref:COBRA-like protein n=1 Tax=Punica granatum TaxID=22663 RepID=A0A6P8CAI6_PUNGR|nr:protein COBRA-like isoform X2 [Punica granatum]